MKSGYLKMGQYAKAEPLLIRSLAIAEKTEGPNHPSTAAGLNNLAGLYRDMGQYARAEPAYARALTILAATRGPEHPEVGTTLNNLARLNIAMDQPAKALQLYLRALLVSGNAGSPELAWNVQSNLRAAYARVRQPGLAIFYGKQAVNTLQGIRATLSQLDRELQRGFLTGKIHVYRELADLLIEQNRLPEAQHVLGMLKEEEFFDFMRRSEGDDPRRRKIAFQPHEQPWHDRLAQYIARMGATAAERSELERRAQSGLKDDDKARLAELSRMKEVLSAGLQRYYREVATAFASAKGKGRNEAADAQAQLKATQQTLSKLGAGSVLVQYILSENRLNVIFTTATTQAAHQVEINAAELRRKIEFFRTALGNPDISAEPMAQELYKLLIAPLDGELRTSGARTLMFSLDGALRYIPMAALHDGSLYLVQRYDLSIYTDVTRDNLGYRQSGALSIVGMGVTREIGDFASLPAVRTELSAIVRNGDKGLIEGELHFDDQFTLASL